MSTTPIPNPNYFKSSIVKWLPQQVLNWGQSSR